MARQNLLRDRPARSVLLVEAEDQVPLQGGAGAVYGRVPEEGSRTPGEHREAGREGRELRNTLVQEELPRTEEDILDGLLSGLASHHHRRRHHREGRLRGTVHEYAYSLSEGYRVCACMGLSSQS